MSNVVTLNTLHRQSQANRLARLTALFATQRRIEDDVFWLKENAEWLGILASSDVALPEGALAPFEAFYTHISQRLQFFPQYYRFFLSLCLDLEDLGLAGDTGRALCDWVADAGLVEAELSDLQRAEAGRLLARRGVGVADPALVARLHHFIDRSDTFALPNKKAAYELTHIVFYLAEYGQRDPKISKKAVQSLEYAGLLAYLDQNFDLLAEVCAALRMAGQRPSPIWEHAVKITHADFALTADADCPSHDGYHEYLVTGWAASLAGDTAFRGDVPDGPVTFERLATVGPLRALSESLLALGDTRSGDWSQMRGRLMPLLSQDGYEIVAHAEGSSDCFEAFFEGFARAVRPNAVALEVVS